MKLRGDDALEVAMEMHLFDHGAAGEETLSRADASAGRAKGRESTYGASATAGLAPRAIRAVLAVQLSPQAEG